MSWRLISTSFPSVSVGSRCGLTRSELKEFHWVTEEGHCKALCADGSKCGDPYAKHAAGWSPRLVGVELNPGPCQGAVSEGKCDQGCILTHNEVKQYKPDGVCDCGHSYLRHAATAAQSTVELYGCFAPGCGCMSYFEGTKAEECKCGHANNVHSKTPGLKTPPKSVASVLMSSSTRRQEKLKNKLLVRQEAKPDGSDAKCDICSRPCQRSVSKVAHIIPFAFRALIYADRHKDQRRLHGKLHSPTDVSNALWLCGTCDGAFEAHDIDIDENGTIVIRGSFLSNCDPVYVSLNGTKVWWHDKMNLEHSEYPAGSVCRFRMESVPPPSSKEGRAFKRALTKEFEQVVGTKRKISEFEEESDDEDEDEDEEDEETKQAKQAEIKKRLTKAGFSEIEITDLMRAEKLSRLLEATRIETDPLTLSVSTSTSTSASVPRERLRPMRRAAYITEMLKRGWELVEQTDSHDYYFNEDLCQIYVRLRG